MLRSSRVRLAAVAAVTAPLLALPALTAAPAVAATQVNPLLPVVAGEYVAAGISYNGASVWYRGAWLREGRYLVQDRPSGALTELAADWTYGARSGLVSDNTDLFLQIAPAPVYEWAGAWLLRRSTGAGARVDTASDGTPLAPAWAGTCDEDCGFTGRPSVLVAPESISRDGRWVAFCANYAAPTVFDFYLKDLVTGTLSVRAGACAQGGPESMRGESFAAFAPEVDRLARVVHLRGALDSEEGYFYNDTLLFPATGATRTVNGQGSMTRDGGTIFLRVGSYPSGTPDTTGGRVGAYNVRTGKIRKLTGRDKIYGSDALRFSAPALASLRGRFVAYGDRPMVVDRKTGRKYNIAKILAAHGFPAPDLSSSSPLVSGDGRVVLVRSADQYVAVKFR